MDPQEFWWHAEAKVPVKMYGRMTQSEVDDIFDDMKEHGLI